MNYIKIFHQDGLIYFDKFQVAELILLKIEDPNKCLLMVDVQCFDAIKTESEKQELEKELQFKINTEALFYDFAFFTIDEYIDLPTIDELNDLTINPINQENGDPPAYIYLGWHIGCYENEVKFWKKDNTWFMQWVGLADDINYYDERAKKNKVEARVKLEIFIFETKEDFQTHERKKEQTIAMYYSILRNMLGQAIPQKDNIDIILPRVSTWTALQKSDYAWKLAIEHTK
jgi:hypothetical protein